MYVCVCAHGVYRCVCIGVCAVGVCVGVCVHVCRCVCVHVGVCICVCVCVVKHGQHATLDPALSWPLPPYRYEEQQNQLQKEDLSDVVAEHRTNRR